MRTSKHSRKFVAMRSKFYDAVSLVNGVVLYSQIRLRSVFAPALRRTVRRVRASLRSVGDAASRLHEMDLAQHE